MTEVLSKIVTGLTRCLHWLLIAAMALLVLDVVWGVITRYVGGAQASWTEELARFLLVWVSLLGGALAFETQGHLGVDFFVAKFDPSVRKGMKVFSHIVVLFFAITVFIIGGGRFVYDALVLDQMTPALGWKMGYVYLVVPIAGFFMSLFTIDNIMKTISGDRNTEPVELN